MLIPWYQVSTISFLILQTYNPAADSILALTESLSKKSDEEEQQEGGIDGEQKRKKKNKRSEPEHAVPQGGDEIEASKKKKRKHADEANEEGDDDGSEKKKKKRKQTEDGNGQGDKEESPKKKEKKKKKKSEEPEDEETPKKKDKKKKKKSEDWEAACMSKRVWHFCFLEQDLMCCACIVGVFLIPTMLKLSTCYCYSMISRVTAVFVFISVYAYLWQQKFYMQHLFKISTYAGMIIYCYTSSCYL